MLLFVKSWKERVRLAFWTCAEHADDALAPQMSPGEDDLHVFVASESLAEAARAELKAARRRDLPDRPAGVSSGPSTKSDNPQKPSVRDRAGDRAPAEDEPPPPSRPLPTRTELPPLKLAGEEEDAP